jgi:TPR repeat protein
MPGAVDTDWDAKLETKGLHNLRVLKAYMLFSGTDTPGHCGCAQALFEEAERNGDHEASMELYILESTGQGCPVDNDKAIAHLRLAAERGSQRAMCNLGGFHATGNGVPKDEQLSVEWYAKAAELGSVRGIARSRSCMARGRARRSTRTRRKSMSLPLRRLGGRTR